MPEDRQDDQNDGSKEQENQQEQEQDNQESGDSGSGPKPDGQTDSSDSAGGGDEDKAKALQDKYDALRRDNLAKQKELDKLKAASKKANADKDAAKERDEAVERADKLQSVLDNQFLKWSIATNSQYQWNDPADVQVFIKSDEINIDLETGEVEGLDLALKRIAKEKPYLLKKNNRDDDDEGRRGPSGQGGQGRGTGVKADDAEVRRLGQKFKIPGFGAQAVRPV
jgi:hypothetical protein